MTRVRTDAGDVECEVVVDAAGMFAAEIARMVGVRVPIIPMSHQYVVTQPLRELGPDVKRLPTLRDPDLLVYYREDVAGLVMGGYERQSRPFALGPDGLDAVPADFNGRLLPEEWERLEEIYANSVVRVPVMETAEIRTVVNGPEAFTPDNEFCLGPTDVRGFWVAAGFCAHGIAGAGGMGKAMAGWILDGDPEHDLWEMDVRRFGAQYRSPSYTLARVVENYETYYDIKYPGQERLAGRPLRVSPAYPWHVAHDAELGEKSGWERVSYYRSNAALGDPAKKPRGWAGELWSPAIEAEHRATRESVGLFDESSFAKIEVSGAGRRDVPRVDVRQPRGARARQGHLHPAAQRARRGRGRPHGEPARPRDLPAGDRHGLRWPRPRVAASARPRGRVGGAARRHVGVDVLRALGTARPRRPGVRSRRSRSTTADFPFMNVRESTVAGAPARIARVTFVGELGWEVYVPTEYGLSVWTALADAVRDAGGLPCGYKAIDSLRAEKGYRYWGSDVTPDETPYEAGLGFCVRMDKDGGFLGREALVGRDQPRAKARLPDSRGPPPGGAGQRAGPGGRGDRRSGHLRRERPLGGRVHRVRVPACGVGVGRDGGRGAGLRGVGGRCRRRGHAPRPDGRAPARLTACRTGCAAGRRCGHHGGVTVVPHTLLRPQRGGNAFETTVERLVQTIKLGVVPSGERLPPERELADALQVGRTTLREALEALAPGRLRRDPTRPRGRHVRRLRRRRRPHGRCGRDRA